ncbi:zinc finger MYM-type protein 1-like [Simochromis diagramma]|uniref:zinc finger MYM-type protein 1-like n=1 Tax=Simochromis diagramma TaxID=43689 RepID=UPI001A7E6161|nr:zinc finger MYM-type protein 1-like [Simochromis diagramma]
MASKRQQESGAEKRKKKRKRDETQASLAGKTSIVQGGSQGQDEPSSSSAIPGHQPPAIVDPATIPSQEEQEPSTTSSGTVPYTSTTESPVTERLSESDTVETCVPPSTDPALWPAHIVDADRVEIVRRGPFNVSSDFNFPKGPDGRAFHTSLKFKILPNGEKVHRSWLVYSPQNNAVFCFACKLFSVKDIKLSTEGFSDWSNINIRLRGHECSQDHIQCMLKWRELDTRLKKSMAIDQQELTLLEAERKKWREILKRLLSITLSLASRNLSFRGSSDCLYEPDNGNFLKEVELMATYDLVMANHLANIKDEGSHTHYLSPETQNELIQIISSETFRAIVKQIQLAKYFSIILDCTPDVSHTEQMSVIVRIVCFQAQPDIKEYFLGYINVEQTTGLNLSNVVLDKLKELGIPFENCRGQAYDNGANMKGKKQGVQARLLQLNPRALFVPCGAHTMNLVIADAAKSSPDATGYFGYLQKLFNFFSSATQRWAILTKHVKLTLKSWSDVRWESRLQSVTAVRSQTKEVRDALLEAREAVSDAVAKVEAQVLAEEVASFRFLICSIVWCELLTITNQVNKLLQSSSMQLDVAVRLIDTAKSNLSKYRQSGFDEAVSAAKELCEALNIEPQLKEKRLRSTKRQFAYEAVDEPLHDALKKLEVTFFNCVVDSALISLQERFETMNQVKEKYGVLLDFSKVNGMSKEDLKKHCTEVQKTLTDKGVADIDGPEMMQEIINLPQLPPQTSALEMLSFLHDNQLQEVYPNLWIALRIALTLPVTVASAERSFSKLKLIKTYLRSSMGQERLSGLAVISINGDVAQKLSYDDLIADFATRKCRRVPL